MTAVGQRLNAYTRLIRMDRPIGSLLLMWPMLWALWIAGRGQPDGYVLLPNVNPLIEIMDMREAQRSYEADLTVMTATKTMLSHTVDLLK